MVLRAVVQSEEMMNMLRHAGLATGEKEPPAEPKMTRAMARKVEAEGLTVPYLVAPATPPRIPDPEVVFLAGGQLQEEEEGDKDTEYRPDLDPFADDDDDDSLFSEGTPRSQREESFSSCLSTPVASQVWIDKKKSFSEYFSPQSTPNISRTPDHGTFKRPFLARGSNSLASRVLDFDTAPPEKFEGYSTRSKNPMTDKRIEDIEQQFIPFDITPDMYDPVETWENDDYSTFLKEMYNEEVYNDDAYNEEEDTEFVYCPDEADEHTKDPEELRNDKATKVTKKEVAELMAELCEFADSSLKTDGDESRKKKVAKKKRAQLPGEQIFEAIKEHTVKGDVNKAVKDTESTDPLPESQESESKTVAEAELTSDQRQVLGLQLSQHIQLLTQMSLLASHNSTWRSVKGQCSSMLAEVAAASLRPGSIASQTNLYTSLAVLEEWDNTGQDPTTVTKNKNSKKYKKRNVNFDISDPLIEFMARQRVFYFPALLPDSALAQDCSRIAWTDGEDHLLALALAATAPSLSKTGLTELSFALQARYMRAKSAVQIRARIKNLKVRDSEEANNPVVHFIKTGEARTCKVAISTIGNGSQSLLEMLRAGEVFDFSPLWTRKLHAILQRRGSDSEPRRLQPAPSVLPFPPFTEQTGHIQKVILVAGPPLAHPLPPSPPPIHRAILCLDGQTGTPTSTSEGEDGPPPSSSNGKSPIKLKIKLRTHPYKSPMKAASDRILRKYSVSPRKLRPLRPIHLKTSRRESAPCIVQRILPPTMASPTRSPPRAISPPPSDGSRDMADSVETPTTLARRKSRGQKEAELTLALVGPLESAGEKELREERESREMFEQIRKAIAGNEEKQLKFTEIIDFVETAGTVATYTALHSLLDGHPIVQESLLDLLSDSEAQELGDLVFTAHQQRVRMKQFVLRLSVAYRHQPAYHARILRELDNLCSDPHLAPETLRAAASRLFKHNAFLLEQFLLLVPGTEPPEACLPSPEVSSDRVIIQGEIFRCMLTLAKRFSLDNSPRKL